MRKPLPVAFFRSVQFFCLFLGILCCLTHPPIAYPQSIIDQVTGTPGVPWQISADTVDYDAESSTYHARGDVIIEKEAARMVADTVDFNHRAMTATAEGNVVLTVGKDILTGDRLKLDLTRETGVVHHGTLFLQQNHFFIRGERIEKTGKDTYRAENGAVTTCDGDRPDWVITGRTVAVTVEGYGTATHAMFKAKDVPVLYTPYLFFPAKTKRQTGFLLPEAGYSDRKGISWDQPLFWAINDSSDATLTTHYMEKRGTKFGIEYRYALTEDAFGTIMADGFEDRQIDDGTPENTKSWGYAGDGYDRPNTDRYWVRAKIDQELPLGATAQLDLDIVSDQDYLTEFREGRSGFDETRDAFLATFGRDIDTYDESTRTNRLNINRTWSKATFNGDLLWNDNVTNRRWEQEDMTLQRLPVLGFSTAKQQAFDSNIYWDMDVAYTYFYRQDENRNNRRGHRSDLYPRAYLPLRWENYLSLEPSVGFRQTTWVMDRWEDETEDRTHFRQIYDARLDLSSEFSKVMASPVSAADRLRHSIKPQLIYEYIPDQDQSDLPRFTQLDRIEGLNRITWALTNTLTARSKGASVSADAAAQATMGSNRESGTKMGLLPLGVLPSEESTTQSAIPTLFDYNRFLRFYLEQSYYFNSQELENREKKGLAEPFSEIYGELDVNLGRYLLLGADGRYDPSDARFTRHNVNATAADGRGDRFLVEHRYTKEVTESIYSQILVMVTDRLALTGEYERNLLEKEDISKGVGLLYTAQCWSIDLFLEKEGEDTRFSFLVNLLGIGGFGQ